MRTRTGWACVHTELSDWPFLSSPLPVVSCLPCVQGWTSGCTLGQNEYIINLKLEGAGSALSETRTHRAGLSQDPPAGLQWWLRVGAAWV